MMDENSERAKVEAELDRELEGTFPASDPLSIVQPPQRKNAAPRAKTPQSKTPR